jgi:hypothetical protein
MIVQTTPGVKCPMENNPREYITDAEPVEVPDTAYYRRLVADGSLVEIPPAPPFVKGGGKAKGGDA